MDATKLKAVDKLLDRFIVKQQKQNDPLKRQMATKEAQSFQSMVSEGIKAQADWTTKFIKDTDILVDNLEPLSGMQADDLKRALHDMPVISNLVSEKKVFAYFVHAFTQGVGNRYQQFGFTFKSEAPFNLTNQAYLQSLRDQANYLLHKSSLDDTTRDRLISLIGQGKEEGLTIDEIAQDISDQFEKISDRRAFTIANTETNQAMSSGELASMKENDVPKKSWIIAGAHPFDDECDDNEGDGEIPVDESFSSGDDAPPAHPNCECYLEASEINLSSIDIWSGD